MLTKEMETTHATEVRQQLEHQKSILELKLQTSEASTATKDKQLADLQKQLNNASAQLKDMAVTVIRAANQPSQQTASSAS